MSDGLFLAYTDPGSVSDDEYHDWYDNEHLPARLTVPGFRSGARYRAADGAAPPWLAAYDIDPGTLDTPAYKDLRVHNSEREKSILARLATLDRREYTLISDERPTGAPVHADASPALLLVSLSVPPGAEDDLHAWYAEEHTPMLLAVPGWRRSRRYRQVMGTGPEYLAFHETDGPHVFETDAFKAAVTTPWRDKIIQTATARERRVFTLHKEFGAPGSAQ